MAKDDETTPRKKGKATSIVVWALMAMLVLGLGGFGITNFGGGLTTIGKVGDREIDVNDYARALQQEVNALSAQFGTQLSMQQALAFGLDQQVRQQLVNTAALDNETDRIGLSAGDARIAKEITDAATFRGPSGRFDRETYRFTLERNNLTEAQYETRMREDLARALLQGAVTGGFTAPQVLTNTLYAHISERRALKLLRLSAADLPTPVAAPTDDDIKAHYEANIAEFTAPEARRITYAALLPESIADQMQVDEDTLRKLYDERIAEFVQPERRLVERLVFPTEAAAAEAKAKLDAGTSFEDLVTERGVKLSDIDLGDRAEADLGAAGAAVFALEEPGVVGPFASDLGPALFRMNGILAAENISFEEARPDLAAELATDAARRAIADQIEAIDDRLASGATLEELDSETDMTTAVIDFTDESNEGIAGYPEFRKAATEAQEGDFPEVITLEDGGIFALRLDAIVPPTPIPLDAARDAVAASWTQAATTKALSDLAVEIKSKVEAGAALGGFGVTEVIPDVARSSTIADAPPTVLTTLFTMDAGQTRVIEEGAFVALVQVETITPGSGEGPEAEALKGAISAQVEQALAQDAFTLFTNALTQEAGITMDNAAINAVHSQFQ
ncbi:peptidylprolyl isomerase [Pseudorhodobacter sp. E13]|uniref:peptidyl-prolyl cis-trans isomerase n=1 Tax=Pseudorhodobacter sp. E13 TaxID=2487931 RepID=UPI000F8CE156|nr:peptidyl-prolyl cis-trans isomerase [Pseudorhodobacter sp. E13]RUS60050.1 peptidylprolyl isomerase [Pseudorhodobacter sp. E13]